MKFSFVPEYRFSSFEDICVDFLSGIGVRGVILDIDNTLEPYENAIPGEHVIKWLKSLSDAGINASIVSNNSRERVETFNKSISLPAYFKARKPFKKYILRAMTDMHTSKKNTVLIGDQVFTDVWAAHNAGIQAILVPPIKDKRDVFTRIKRVLEKPFLKIYESRHKK